MEGRCWSISVPPDRIEIALLPVSSDQQEDFQTTVDPKTTSPSVSTTRPSEIELPPALTVDLGSPHILDWNDAESTHLTHPPTESDAATFNPNQHSWGANPVVETNDSIRPSSITILPSIVDIAPSATLVSHKETASTSSVSSSATSNSGRFSTSTSTTTLNRSRLSTPAASFLEPSFPTISIQSQLPTLEENILNNTLWEKLYEASTGSHLDGVQKYIWKGPDPLYRIEYRWTSLYWPAHNGHYDVVQFLASHGAELAPISDTNVTPLNRSLVAGHAKISRILEQAGGIRCPVFGSSAPLLQKRKHAEHLRSSVEDYRSKTVPRLIELYDSQSSPPYKSDRGSVDLGVEFAFTVSTASVQAPKRNTPLYEQGLGAPKSFLTAVENAISSPVLVSPAVTISKTAPRPELRRMRSTSVDSSAFDSREQDLNVDKHTKKREWKPLYTALANVRLVRPYVGRCSQTIHMILSPNFQPHSNGQEYLSLEQDHPNLQIVTRTYTDVPFVGVGCSDISSDSFHVVLSGANSHGTSFARKTVNAEHVNTWPQQVIPEAKSIKTPDETTDEVQNVHQQSLSHSPFIPHKIEDFTAYYDFNYAYGDNDDDCNSVHHPSRANLDSLPSEQREALRDTDIQDTIRDELPQHQSHLAEDIFESLRTKSIAGSHEPGQFVPTSEILKSYLISADTCCNDEYEFCCNDQGESQGENYGIPSEESTGGDNGDDSHQAHNDMNCSRVNKGRRDGKDVDGDDVVQHKIIETPPTVETVMLRCPALLCHRRFQAYSHLSQHCKEEYYTGKRCKICKLIFHNKRDRDAHFEGCYNKKTRLQNKDDGFSCTACPGQFSTQIARDFHLQTRPQCDEVREKPYSVFGYRLFEASIQDEIEKKFKFLGLSKASIMNEISIEGKRQEQFPQPADPSAVVPAETWQVWVLRNSQRKGLETKNVRDLAKWYWTRKIMYPNLLIPWSPYADTLDDADGFNLIKQLAMSIRQARERDEPPEEPMAHRDDLFERHSECYSAAYRIVENIRKIAGKARETPQLLMPGSTESGSSSQSVRPPNVQPMSKVTQAADNPEPKPAKQTKRRKQTHDQQYTCIYDIPPANPSAVSPQTLESNQQNQQNHKTQRSITNMPETTHEVSGNFYFQLPPRLNSFVRSPNSYTGSDHDIYRHSQGQAMTSAPPSHSYIHDQPKYDIIPNQAMNNMPQHPPNSGFWPLEHQQFSNPQLEVGWAPAQQSASVLYRAESTTNQQAPHCDPPATNGQPSNQQMHQQFAEHPQPNVNYNFDFLDQSG